MYNDKIVLEMPTLNAVHQRLEAIEQKLEQIASFVENQQIDKPSISGKKMLTLQEASEAYGFSIWSLRYKASRREIPLVRIGRRLYINVTDFEKWLDEKKIEEIKYD